MAANKYKLDLELGLSTSSPSTPDPSFSDGDQPNEIDPAIYRSVDENGQEKLVFEYTGSPTRSQIMRHTGELSGLNICQGAGLANLHSGGAMATSHNTSDEIKNQDILAVQGRQQATNQVYASDNLISDRHQEESSHPNIQSIRSSGNSYSSTDSTKSRCPWRLAAGAGRIAEDYYDNFEGYGSSMGHLVHQAGSSRPSFVANEAIRPHFHGYGARIPSVRIPSFGYSNLPLNNETANQFSELGGMMGSYGVQMFPRQLDGNSVNPGEMAVGHPPHNQVGYVNFDEYAANFQNEAHFSFGQLATCQRPLYMAPSIPYPSFGKAMNRFGQLGESGSHQLFGGMQISGFRPECTVESLGSNMRLLSMQPDGSLYNQATHGSFYGNATNFQNGVHNPNDQLRTMKQSGAWQRPHVIGQQPAAPSRLNIPYSSFNPPSQMPQVPATAYFRASPYATYGGTTVAQASSSHAMQCNAVSGTRSGASPAPRLMPTITSLGGHGSPQCPASAPPRDETNRKAPVVPRTTAKAANAKGKQKGDLVIVKEAPVGGGDPPTASAKIVNNPQTRRLSQQQQKMLEELQKRELDAANSSSYYIKYGVAEICKPADIVPLGERCQLCRIDLAFRPPGATDPPSHSTADPLPVSVLPCGHCYHASCLEEISGHLMLETWKEPPCISCPEPDRNKLHEAS